MTDPARVHGGYAPTAAPAPAPLPADVAVALAAGVDTNPAGAEALRRYWTTGEGGTKTVHWGTPGDFTRCVRALREHLGTRAEGYCALRHHEMTGMYPGDRRNQ